ncbi:MAG: alkaline phosphatase family protein [Candidatus Micrarchaeaceae archaeon]
MPAKKSKLYVIGVDSAPLWIVKGFAKRYHLKGFESLMKDGTLLDMQSTLPPLTPVAWPTIYTGLEPREHGMMDFFRIDREYTKQLLYYDSDKHKPFWDALAKKGKKCLVITPAEALKLSKHKNVDLITGWPLPPRFSSKQIEAAAKRFGFDGEPGIEKDLQDGKITVSEASKRYVKSIENRAELSKHLITKNKYDMAFVCFTETDRIQHYTLNNRNWEEYVMPLYKSVSDFIEWTVLRAKKEGAAVIVVSDHGAQPIRKKFLLNGWLVNSGYAELKPSIIKSIQENYNGSGQAEEQANLKYSLREKLIKSKARGMLYDKLPASAKRIVGKAIGTALSSASGATYTRIHDFDFDMKSTVAFTSVSNDPVGMIWINDKRFSKPSVTDSEKKRVKAEIAGKLKEIKTEDGKPLVTKVYDGDIYYKNTKLFIAPDLLVALREGYVADVKNYSLNSLYMEPELAKSGDHTMNGIFGSIGPFDGKKIKKGVNVLNVEPTILTYFGIKCEHSSRSLIR